MKQGEEEKELSVSVIKQQRFQIKQDDDHTQAQAQQAAAPHGADDSEGEDAGKNSSNDSTEPVDESEDFDDSTEDDNNIINPHHHNYSHSGLLHLSASSPQLSYMTHDKQTTEPTTSQTSAPSRSVSSFLSLLSAELFSLDTSGSSSHPSSSPRQLVYNFLILPYFLERLLTTGFFICLDCFLYLFTILPFRILHTLFTLLTSPLSLYPSSSSHRRPSTTTSSPLSRDLLRFLLLFLCWYALSHIPMSRIYHYIRGQSVLKLYVIFNMLQIMDRLFASIGEDILDALFSSVSLPLPYLLFHFCISALYVFLHSLLLFTQVITLNVSVNSDNSSLFIVLVSNNFVELKGAVFRRYDAHNLFQISCSDIVERFQLVIFLAIIIVMNLSHLGLSLAWELSWLDKAVNMCLMVMLGECAVDWIKHGFICKFNMISPRVYRQFSQIIHNDFVQAHIQHTQYHTLTNNHTATTTTTTTMTTTNHPSITDDTTTRTADKSSKAEEAHSVARRLGLSCFPLAVLVLRVLSQAFTHSSASSVPVHVDWLLKAVLLLLLFIVLIVMKLLLTVTLLAYIAHKEKQDKQEQQQELLQKQHQQHQQHKKASKIRSREGAKHREDSSRNGDDLNGVTKAKRKDRHVLRVNTDKRDMEAQTVSTQHVPHVYYEQQTQQPVKEETVIPKLEVVTESSSQTAAHPAADNEHAAAAMDLGRSSTRTHALSLSNQQHEHEQLSVTFLAVNPPSLVIHTNSAEPSTCNSQQGSPLSTASASLPTSLSCSSICSPVESPVHSASSVSPSLPSPITPNRPLAHIGDVLPVHERVGSVQLVVPSIELYHDLQNIDRYKMSNTKTAIPS